LYSYNSYSAVGEAAAIVVVLVLLMVIPLLVLGIIGICKVFKKAGRPVGFAFIPVYSYYVQYDFTGCKYLFWVYLPLFIVNTIVSMVPYPDGFLSFLSGCCSIGLIVVQVLSSLKLAKAFGKSTGFAMGLIFLYPIFLFILGQGDSQYVGPDGQYTANAAPQAVYQAAPQAMPQAAPQQNNGVWRCPNCGAYNLAENNFCFQCGQQKRG